MKLDIGSGHIYREGFKRVDIDPDVNAHYRIKAEDVGKSFTHNTIDEIYCAHCLEHIAYKDCFNTLRGFWKVMKPKGLITIIVPNIGRAVEKYNDSDWAGFERIVLGSNPDATEWMVHRNLFNLNKINRFLTITGFTDIRCDEYASSDIIEILAYKPMDDVKGKKK